MQESIKMSFSILKADSSYLSLAKDSIVSISKLLVKFLKGSPQTEFKDRQALIGILLIAFGTQVYYWQKFSFWKRRNIKTPNPVPLFGNSLSFFLHSRQKLEVEWPKKYGKVYGYYIGTKPYLVCADAKVLKNICIKDFDKFPNHYFASVVNKYHKHFLIVLKDDEWRTKRALVAPAFSSTRIKTMFRIMTNIADDLIALHRNEIEQNGGLAITDSRQIFGAYSMGSALSSFCGISLDRGTYSNYSFSNMSQMAFKVKLVTFILHNLLPDELLRYLNIPINTEEPFSFFSQEVKKFIRYREKSSRTYDDYLQLLLQAKDLNDEAKLSEEEVAGLVTMKLIVGTETTATLLTHILYLLAHHPEVQETLYNELTRNVEEKEIMFDYERLNSCLYLNAVISETLRLMPPSLVMDRVASEDYYIKEYDCHIPKGTIVNLPFYAILRDPDYWREPEKFDPDRFMPDRKDELLSEAYCPFGIGPRTCPGQRFAMIASRVAIAKLVTQFQFETAPGSKYPPKPKKTIFIVNDNANLHVAVRKRENEN